MTVDGRANEDGGGSLSALFDELERSVFSELRTRRTVARGVRRAVLARIRATEAEARAVADSVVHGVMLLEEKEELATALRRQGAALREENRRVGLRHAEMEARVRHLLAGNERLLGLLDETQRRLTDTERVRRELLEVRSSLETELDELSMDASALAEANVEALALIQQRDDDIADMLAKARAIDADNHHLRAVVARDELTGLFNFRHLQTMLESEVARARRYDRPLSLLFLDIDRFKQLNDTYGHEEGNRTLKRLGAHLVRFLRDCDVTFVSGDALAARYGGEEFAVLLPETDLAGATMAAERLRQSVHDASLSSEGCPPITISIGVVTLDQDDDAASLLARVDHAMHEAKRTGRDRVAVAPSAASQAVVAPAARMAVMAASTPPG